MKMKRKVIRVCSLVLLSVAVSTTLVGCSSKSEKDTAASSTTSTSKVVKSSAKTKASEKKSAKKAKTENSSSNVDYEPYRQSSTTAKAVQISGNLYVWEGGDFSTLLPGITGLGGAGFQAKPGFILENGTYTPVQFISDLGPTFDYSNYNAFPFSLTK